MPETGGVSYLPKALLQHRGPAILDPLLLLPFFLLGAFLYASVGHGGATVYLAILLLAGYARTDVLTPVLVLNVLVASLGFLVFWRAGHLRARLLWPLLITSVPAAFLGASVNLTGWIETLVLGGALLLGAARLLLVPGPPRTRFHVSERNFVPIALPLGALLGFLAGATGIGGGIFLSPVLLFLGWATVKQAGAIASGFIVLNSLGGLAARWSQAPPDPNLTALLAAAALTGGAIGALLGARRLPQAWVQRLLGLVLVVAAARTLIH